MKKNLDLGLLVLRLSIGVLMLLHGFGKFAGLGFIKGMLAEAGLPGFIAYGVYLGEIVAPLLIIVGFRARLASVVYIVNVLVAIFLVHAADTSLITQYPSLHVD